ncbi:MULTISPECIES: histidine phosphatase family protein [Niastella]|uniref:Histidine phosphatase family protein n=1 Tax=Niastella soli TaxID=2821487 RepID=A0ABS3Z4M4_9BACT|nr:histidine phosphatase family protein [Niastella soli]MBO9204326.1 histidine phosphatase family protein [Niastella soli]
MDKELYIIRHGETDYNRLGIVQGRGVNTDLNDLGREQGKAFYQYYKHVPFDKVYTSALKRTHQTVKNFLEEGIPWELLPGLDELSFGIWEGNESKEDWLSAFHEMKNYWQSGQCDLSFEKGESPNQVSERLQEALDVILSRPTEKRVLICMHGRSLLVLLCMLSQSPISCMANFNHSNTCLYRVSYFNGRFSILEANDVRHLTNS